jgi:hypothetical protein
VSDDFDFHYRREDRLAKHSAPRPRPSASFLQSHRRSAVLFLNLAIIVVLLALYARLIGGAESGRLPGCRLTLHAAPEGDAVEAVLEAEVVDAAATGQRLFAVFVAGEADLRISEVLPAVGGRIALRGRLDAADVKDVRVRVSVAGKSTGLRVALKPLDRGRR